MASRLALRRNKVNKSRMLEQEIRKLGIYILIAPFLIGVYYIVVYNANLNLLSSVSNNTWFSAALTTALIGACGFFVFKMISAVSSYQKLVEQQTEEKVTKTEGKYKALIQNTQDMITIIDPKGKIIYQSPSCTRILGYSPEEMLGQNIFDIIHQEDHPFVQNAIALKQNSFQTNYRMQHHDSSWLYFEGFGMDAVKNPLIGGIVLNSRDVTDKKREEELAKQKELAAIRFNIEKEKAEKEKQIIEESRKKIEEAYHLVEEAHNEITDSINYAFRIQNAIFPDPALIRQHLPKSFVMWRPKDIVSGDFFWFYHRDDYYLFSAADCTGHGVPGAFMTMIGNTVLNQLVMQLGLIYPDEILNNLHIRIRTLLKQDTTSSRDGMDISLMCYDKKNRQMHWAGANNPLILVRNGELIEYKADKKSIGGVQTEEARIFTRHTIDVQKGDVFYAYSDGYQDQFGGEKGRKFMSKNLKELLAQISTYDFDLQRETLNQRFVDWLGTDYHQIDDVLVVGLGID